MTVNVVDTPGHADFGGEVERGLSMVDGVVLLVDASEGPLPQTRFVLRKTLAAGLPVVLVVNKTDRAGRPHRRGRRREPRAAARAGRRARARRGHHRPACSTCPVVYASGRAGRASRDPPRRRRAARLAGPRAAVRRHARPPCPPPADDPDAPLQAHVTNLDATSFLGRIALCRVRAGVIRRGQQVAWCRADGKITRVKITELLRTEALDPRPGRRRRARATSWPSPASPDVTIGDTLADPDDPVAAARASTSTSPRSRSRSASTPRRWSAATRTRATSSPPAR